MGKKITIIGTINKDLILPFRGGPIESLGGIFYSAAILASLMDSSDEIVPISFLGEDMADTVRAALLPYPNINPEALHLIPQKNQKVILEYTSPQQRREKALFNFPPLQWRHIRKHLDADFIIINLITGWDLALDAYEKIVSKFATRTYLDVHYLVKGVDSLGRRFPEKPETIDRWIQKPAFVQMNDEEFEIVTGGGKKDVDFYEEQMNADQTLLITKGSDGAKVIYTRKGMMREKVLPAPALSAVVDATGCGDAFGAGFIKSFIQDGDAIKAVRYANRVAAANALLEGANEISRLKSVMAALTSE